MILTTDPDDIPDLDVHGTSEAAFWVTLALAGAGGMALTAGWMLRTAWAVIRRVESRAWVRSAR